MGNRHNNKRNSRRKEIPPEKAYEIRKKARLSMEKHKHQLVISSDTIGVHDTMTSSSSWEVKEMEEMDHTQNPTSSEPPTNNPLTRNDDVAQHNQIVIDVEYVELNVDRVVI